MNQSESPEQLQTKSEHRVRLLRAMADVAADKGYAEVTIADIVREAGVSKRTFYEHFASKDTCFLELYRAASLSALRALRSSFAPEKPWQAQLENALGAYFSHLAMGPALVRTLFVEIHQLGPAGMQMRREVMRHLADFMLATVNADPLTADAKDEAKAPPVRELSPTMALAAVGGIHELVLHAIETRQEVQLAELTPQAAAIVRALVLA